MHSISEKLRKIASGLENDDFIEKCSKKEAYLSQRAELPNLYPVEKLTIEIEGYGGYKQLQ